MSQAGAAVPPRSILADAAAVPPRSILAGAATLPPRHAVAVDLDPRLLDGFDPGARVIDLAGATMGTGWRVRVALPRARDPAPLRDAIERRLAQLVAQMSHWSADSLLSRFNSAPAGTWIDLPADFAAVIACGLDVAAKSGGAFDPAIGRLTDLWGLGANARAQAPSSEAVAQARAASGFARLAYDPATARLRQPGGRWLDLSGIAKGYASDAVAALLAAAGLRHALVEIGGECVGMGLRPDHDPWWVDLETPPGVVLPSLRIALAGLAVATSGDYVRGLHSLDPRTGMPAIGAPATVSVIHRSCMAADAWATALTVMDGNAARGLAMREGLAARIVEAGGGEWLSPALLAMLEG